MLVPVADGVELAPVTVPVGSSTLRVLSRADGRVRTVDVERGDAGSYVQTALLQASGFAVALSGDTLVVGDEGGARVFERENDEWRYRTTLGGCRDESISFDGTRVALAGRATLIENFGCDAESGAAVAIYRRDGSTWTLEQGFTGFETETGPVRFKDFGDSVAIDGDRLVVGTLSADPPGADGAPVQDAGAVSVYALVDGTWEAQQTLVASNADPRDGFGERVALEGDLLAVSAPREGSAATGVNGDRFDNSYTPEEFQVFSSGAVYLFERRDERWVETTYLKPSDNVTSFYRFGRGLDVDRGRVAVGAPLAAENPDALEFGPAGEVLNRARGRVYLFERDGDTWRQSGTAEPAPGDDYGFGSDLALDGGGLAVLSALRTSAFGRSPGGPGDDGYERLGTIPATGTAIDLDAGRLAVERYQQEGASVFDDLGR